jgi:translocation and assembly module TamB
MSTISPFQALELARTLRRFSGRGGGLDPLGELRGAFGLDDLSIQSDAEGGTTVGACKYISDKVYLQVESGSGDKSGAARLQLELAPNIKAESKIGQDATGGGGIFWEWEY